jgi:dolichyl-phosphate-mannose--protein O-mannosyl transferase
MQIYLIGNIMAWWFGHAVFFAFFAVFLFFFMREARHVFDLSARMACSRPLHGHGALDR